MWSFDPNQIPVSDGMLQIAWPRMLDGLPLKLDLVLTTANRPEHRPGGPSEIAAKWLDKRTDTTDPKILHSEQYFFHNVAAGIRTRDDGPIWECFTKAGAAFIADATYVTAVERLSSEFGSARST